ncbi:antibiotic biosynthesis monooxygenase [Chromobacterium sp. IIBBL 290-4]|uniref:antibiotic biosynthesis monooxygenase family protein n=1 Tax=Chromobacterium sp. IIBBL 290-4 TaxID=2953890 RepID=UPI0020B77EE9|nr:hypothetical protein [Chromobacterium sp. IIBBL 290-4]UTH73701.1 hypothetical protein NKT35_19480 [Chromobacterium sp. IIBBL 290-4]
MKPLDSGLAQPCWAVKLEAPTPALAALSVCALRLASAQPGCLGGDAVEQLSFWDSVDAIAAWRDRVEQLVRQRLGRGAGEFEFTVSHRLPEGACA